MYTYIIYMHRYLYMYNHDHINNDNTEKETTCHVSLNKPCWFVPPSEVATDFHPKVRFEIKKHDKYIEKSGFQGAHLLLYPVI